MSKFSVADETKLAEIEAFLTANNYLSGAALPDANDAQVYLDLAGNAPNKEKYPNFWYWYLNLSAFAEPVLRAWIEKAEKKAGKKEAKEEKAEKNVEDDLFGDDDDEEEKKKLEALKKAKAGEKEKKKKEVIARSIVIFNVKVFEVEQDLDALAKKIMENITMDGLQWRTEYKKVPVAFGMNMLQMGCTIEDDKVSTDDLFEKIQAWEDEVQSVDIESFQKV